MKTILITYQIEYIHLLNTIISNKIFGPEPYLEFIRTFMKQYTYIMVIILLKILSNIKKTYAISYKFDLF